MELSGRLKYLRKISAAGLIALAAWVSLFSPAQAAPSWASLGSADFPARVNAIIFPSGNRIDSSSGVCWGQWCVGFGAEAPVAVFTQCCPSINISDLVCTNPVIGEKTCRIYLINSPDFGLDCNIFGEDIKRIEIRCPQEVRLE